MELYLKRNAGKKLMFSRLLIEKSMQKKVSIKNNIVSQLNYVDNFGINSLMYAEGKTKYKFRTISENNDLHNNKIFDNNQVQEVLNILKLMSDSNFKFQACLTQKNVEKQIYLDDREVKKSNIFYNEAVIVSEYCKNGVIKKSHSNLGVTDKLLSLSDIEKSLVSLKKLSIDFLEAEPADNGDFDILLSPEVSAVLVHEVFGHLLEADTLLKNSKIREYFRVGLELGNAAINITDDPTLKHRWGYYDLDDEGVKPKPCKLMVNGVVNEYLTSINTSNYFGIDSNGHSRLINYKFPPLVRMSNTILEQGESTLDEMISCIDDGYYAVSTEGGAFAYPNFIITVMDGYKIKNGKIKGNVKDFYIVGNVFDILKKIDKIGNQVYFTSGGGCQKYNQGLLPVSTGAPFMLVKNIRIKS